MATFYPVWLAILNGQISPLLLLAITFGLYLQLGSSSFPWRSLSGLVLSCLALKPQFAVLIVVWLALRLDWRGAIGFAVGIAAQFAAVTWMLGVAVWHSYLRNLAVYAQLSGMYRFTPDYEQSLSGILTNLFGSEYATLFKSIHLLIAAALTFGLWRMSQSDRSATAAQLQPMYREFSQAKELAAVVLLCLLGTPHLLVYDLTLQIAPIALLYGCRGNHRTMGQSALALYAGAMLTPIFGWIGASIVPGILIVVSLRLGAGASRRIEQFAHLGQQVVGGVGLGKHLDRPASGA